MLSKRGMGWPRLMVAAVTGRQCVLGGRAERACAYDVGLDWEACDV